MKETANGLLSQQFDSDGVAVISDVVSDDEIAGLRDLDIFHELAKDGRRPGARAHKPTDLLSNVLNGDSPLRKIATHLLGRGAQPVRILFFDKTANSNWAVPWHQDRTIAVQQKLETPGFKSWNIKNGVNHVEPPASLLADMTCLRLHLDDCHTDNGPLNVICGSYRLGRIPVKDIAKTVVQGKKLELTAKAGDVIVMRGLTVHSSPRAQQPSHRRVVHIDYCASELPNGLEWASTEN